jgi:predicted nucleic acid-binding protein
MSEASPFHVLLDANVWVAERLLQSAIGGALLYALTRAKATIVLPEVVELEVNRVLPELAEKAAAAMVAKRHCCVNFQDTTYSLPGHRL